MYNVLSKDKWNHKFISYFDLCEELWSMDYHQRGSDNGLLPGRCQAITWTNAGIILTGPNFNEIFIKIHTFSLKKIQLKICRLENGGHFVSASMCWQTWLIGTWETWLSSFNNTYRFLSSIQKYFIRNCTGLVFAAFDVIFFQQRFR